MNQEERNLRENIRHLIRHVKQKKNTNEEQLREVIREFATHELRVMINEAAVADVDPTPNKSTGINVLEELLKKIVPILEIDYKSLTTETSQRESFRAHIINAVINTLTPAKVNTAAGEAEAEVEDLAEIDMDEEIEINVGGEEPGDDKFIDIRTDAEKDSAEDIEDEDPRDEFGTGVDGDETGRNVAYQCFKKIESSIIDSYELLSNPEDQELYYDYLIANLKLYFDKFEGELDDSVEEPTNQAYDMAKSEQPGETGEEDIELDF
tara:strand:- start:1750 stop:2547 length:798 start_codon:yes stop_codon:yes gene_type:complete